MKICSQNIIELEKTMLSLEVSIPVYFLRWEKELQNIISNVDILTATTDVTYNKKETATEGKLQKTRRFQFSLFVNYVST